MELPKIHCLTIKYAGIVNGIACSVTVSHPQSLLSPGEVAKSDDCIAIWDTGAMGSAITELQAKKLGLIPTGIKNASGLGGTHAKNTYVIDIRLPNNITIADVQVIEIDNPVDEHGKKIEDFGVLIGMNIICLGDFAITNYLGKTVMSFRIPSSHEIDYVKNPNYGLDPKRIPPGKPGSNYTPPKKKRKK